MTFKYPGKERRKPRYRRKAEGCWNHGSCERCCEDRQFFDTKHRFSADEELDSFFGGEMDLSRGGLNDIYGGNVQISKAKERLDWFGKCCWTCANRDCTFSQINNKPPHESSEGRDCDEYVVLDFDESE